jgi:hypothetical protein
MVITRTTRTSQTSRRAGVAPAPLLPDRARRSTTVRGARSSVQPSDPPSVRPPPEGSAPPEGPGGSNDPDDPDDPDHPQGGPGGPGGPGGDPPDDDDNPDDPHADGVQGNLADAIKALADSVRRPKEDRSKVREPDCFDGSDPRKLRTFLVQCRLNFEDRPSAFRTHRAKVTYALSYLKGTALDWFEPELSDEFQEPDWLDDYLDFTHILRENFGPYDPEGDAEADLENLTMKDNQRITKYVVDFNRYAAQVGWGDSAL